MLISIIVPVYNTSKFLDGCLKSIITQEFKDYELLLIDDGSTDDSGQICDRYAKDDDRIKVYHKKNGGVDSARNLGIEEAKGDYLYFVDSDDKLLPGCLQTLVSGLVNDEIELVVAGYIYSRNSVDDELPNTLPTSRIFDRTQIMEELLKPKYQSLGMPWTNLYKASVIRDNHLWFDKSIHSIDDRVFMSQYICAIKGKIYHTTKPIYIYNLGVGVTFQIANKYDKRTATIFNGQCMIYEMVKNGNFNCKCRFWSRFKMMNSYYCKKKYFESYNDFDSVAEMRNRLFSHTSKLQYFIFWCYKQLKKTRNA